jgi:pseudouridine synthase
MRLQKYLAGCGLCSRRDGEAWILAGRVNVNGTVVTKLGSTVDPHRDKVEVDGQPVRSGPPRTVLFHKPAGCLCTRKDPQGRPTIYDRLPPDLATLAYVGRLDYNTSGVLLLTSDGDLAYRLTRPEHRIPRVYVAKVSGHVKLKAVTRMTEGIEVDGQRLAAERVHKLQDLASRTVLEITLTEGKYREVRRLLAAVGHEAVTLTRVEFAGLGLGNLEPGKWRPLTHGETRRLRTLVGLQ